MSSESIRYVYVRNNPKRNPVTIAYAFDDEGRRIVYNYAQCSKRDQFTKATGRAVAEGRLLTGSKKHPNETISYDEVQTEGKVKYKAIAAKFYEMFGSKKKRSCEAPVAACSCENFCC